MYPTFQLSTIASVEALEYEAAFSLFVAGYNELEDAGARDAELMEYLTNYGAQFGYGSFRRSNKAEFAESSRQVAFRLQENVQAYTRHEKAVSLFFSLYRERKTVLTSYYNALGMPLNRHTMRDIRSLAYHYAIAKCGLSYAGRNDVRVKEIFDSVKIHVKKACIV